MRSRRGGPCLGWLLAATPAALAVVSVVLPLAPAGGATLAAVRASVTDVNTNLGYANAAAAGTGFVITAGGVVVTNNHVIRGATQISVRDVGNGRTYPAKVLGYDVPADVAVLGLTGARGLRVAPIGNSSTVRVGAKVTGIGNASGRGGPSSTAVGRVTALHGTVVASDELNGTSESLSGMIVTSAPIVAGYSGGPLANAAGRVIGVNTAGSSDYELQSGTGASYAIPINQVMAIVRAIQAGRFAGAIHAASTAFLGVDLQASGYVANGRYVPGLLVAGVVPASPVERAGIVAGDVLTTFDGKAVSTPTQLTDALLAERPGQSAAIGWVDQTGAPHTSTVVLAAGPPQ